MRTPSLTLIALALALLALAACGPDTTCSSAEASLSYTGLIEQMESFITIGRESEASAYSEIGPYIDRLREVREATAGLTLPACAEEARAAQLAVMDASIEMQEVLLETGNPEAAEPIVEQANAAFETWMLAIQDLQEEMGD
ncbi:MAG: hypothetical protein Kow00124_24820 [Anaerolineae bacterium]